jgi:hypothetical protein
MSRRLRQRIAQRRYHKHVQHMAGRLTAWLMQRQDVRAGILAHMQSLSLYGLAPPAEATITTIVGRVWADLGIGEP